MIAKIANNKSGVMVNGREVRKPSETIINRLNRNSQFQTQSSFDTT